MSTLRAGDEEYHSAMRAMVGQFNRAVDAINRQEAEKDELLAMSDESNRENLEKLRSILNTVVDAIITIDHKGMITAVNPATLTMFGYAEDELIGSNISILMPEPYHSEHRGYLARYMQTGQARIIGTRRELTARRKDGTVLPIELAVNEFQDGAGPMFTGIIHDISKRRELEKHLFETRVAEQQRIARELHDGLGGQMTGLGLLAKAMQNRLEAEHSPIAREVAELARHIEAAHTQLRNISRNLSPVEVLPDGLGQALGELAEQTDKADGIRCGFETDGTALADRTIAAHLYRIAQEAVSNAVRHGHPTHIDIRLETNHGQAVLTISNDGRSFEHFSDTDRGMGIRTMEHRAKVIDGNLWITPGEGGGTVVVCRVPKNKVEP